MFTPAELEYGMSLQFFYKEKALHYQEEDANMMTFTANMLSKMFKFMHLCVSVGVFVFFLFVLCIYANQNSQVQDYIQSLSKEHGI